MSELRLTCVTLEYPPDKGGVASYLHGLLSELGSKTDVIRARVRSLWPRWWPMIKQCRKSQGILVVSHLLPVGTAAWLAQRYGGPAYVLVVHGMDVLLAHRSRWKRWIAQRIMNSAYLVVANSEYTAGLTQERFQRRPLILTPGHVSRILPTRQAARARLGREKNEKIILSIGRLVSRKGFDTLIQACHDLDAQLVIVGNGPDEKRLRTLIAGRQNMHLLTNVSDQDRDAWYAAADIFALLVREEKNDVEGFGIVYLEAAAAGLPIVAGRSGGVSEAVEDTVTGTLVDPLSVEQAKRALRFFLDHPEAAEEMGKAGKRRVQKYFAWEDRARALSARIPLVSVIIPVFNRREVFERCLRALAQQTYRHFETIVIDDGSTEDMRSVIEKYSHRLNIRYIYQENQGPPRARNRGFAESSGEFVLFLDADAILVPNAIEEMTRAIIEYPSADVVYSDHYFGWKQFRGRVFDREALAQGNFIHTSSLIRRTAFPGFDPSLRRFQDWDLWLTMAHQGSKFVWIPRTLFRLESRGTMSTWLPSFFHRIPWTRLGWVPKSLQRYQSAAALIKQKHHL